MNFERETDPEFLRSVAKALEEENRALRAEQAALESALAAARLQARGDSLAREAALADAARARAEHEAAEARREVLEGEHAALVEQMAGLQAELSVLRETLTLREQQLYGKKTERRPSGGAAAGGQKKEKPGKKPRKGHGPTEQPDLPREDVEHSLVGEGLACEHCGGTLAPLGTAAEEAELVAIEARRIVLERAANDPDPLTQIGARDLL